MLKIGAIKGDGKPTRLLPHAKMLLVPIKFFFLCWVDYADDSTEVMEGVTLTPEIFGNKHSFVLTFFATNTIYVNCKRCKP